MSALVRLYGLVNVSLVGETKRKNVCLWESLEFKSDNYEYYTRNLDSNLWWYIDWEYILKPNCCIVRTN